MRDRTEVLPTSRVMRLARNIMIIAPLLHRFMQTRDA
jgi:hypothetical protein